MNTAANANILVVEDDADICTIICNCLQTEGYSCLLADTVADALSLALGNRIDLLICDLMLPDGPGEQIVSRLREKDADLPILIVSARGSTSDKVGLLKMGADDYMTKPFDVEELLARVSALLRRSSRGATSSGADAILRLGVWELDREAHVLKAAGAPVELTRIEYNLVETLASHPQRVFTRPELFEAAWGEPFSDDTNTVNVHVSNLRTKLKATDTDSYIATVWGIGFKLVPPASDSAEAR